MLEGMNQAYAKVLKEQGETAAIGFAPEAAIVLPQGKLASE